MPPDDTLKITVSGTYQSGSGESSVYRIGPLGATGWYLEQAHESSTWQLVRHETTEPITDIEQLLRALSEILDDAQGAGLHVAYAEDLTSRKRQHEFWPATHLPLIRVS